MATIRPRRAPIDDRATSLVVLVAIAIDRALSAAERLEPTRCPCGASVLAPGDGHARSCPRGE